MQLSEQVSSDEVKKWHVLEQEGLDRAKDDNKPSKGDVEWLTKIQDSSFQMQNYYAKMGETQWYRFAHDLGYAAYYSQSDAKKCQLGGSDVSRRDCHAKEGFDRLQDVDDNFENIPREEKPAGSGTICSHFRKLIGRDDYKLGPHLLNDVTACFHRSLEHYEETAKAWHKEGKCMWRE